MKEQLGPLKENIQLISGIVLGLVGIYAALNSLLDEININRFLIITALLGIGILQYVILGRRKVFDKNEKVFFYSKSIRRYAIGWSIILFILIIWLVGRPTKISNTTVIQNCPNLRDTVIRVANFNGNRGEFFSSSLVADLKTAVDYPIFPTGENLSLRQGIRDSIKRRYFNKYSTCDTTGIFIHGDYLQEELFISEMNIFNLRTEFKHISLDSSIILKTPQNMEFSISKNSQFLADFISCTAKVFSGQYLNAIECLENLTDHEEVYKSSFNRSIVALYKGNCYAILGDIEKAKREYRVVKKHGSEKLKKIAIENEKSAVFIAQLLTPNYSIAQKLVNSHQDHKGNTTRNQFEPSKSQTKVTRDQEIPTIIDSNITIFPKFERGPAIKEHPTIKLGEQIWFGSNLNIEVDGDSYCYDYEESNCIKYGRLYTWEAANRYCTELGTGWRLPSLEDWSIMSSHFGGFSNGRKAFSSLREQGEGNFGAQIGGYKSLGGFNWRETLGYYWTSTKTSNSESYSIVFDQGNQSMRKEKHDTSRAFSVRCIKQL